MVTTKEDMMTVETTESLVFGLQAGDTIALAKGGDSYPACTHYLTITRPDGTQERFGTFAFTGLATGNGVTWTLLPAAPGATPLTEKFAALGEQERR